jgi:hypothetical protein
MWKTLQNEGKKSRAPANQQNFTIFGAFIKRHAMTAAYKMLYL